MIVVPWAVNFLLYIREVPRCRSQQLRQLLRLDHLSKLSGSLHASWIDFTFLPNHRVYVLYNLICPLGRRACGISSWQRAAGAAGHAAESDCELTANSGDIWQMYGLKMVKYSSKHDIELITVQRTAQLKSKGFKKHSTVSPTNAKGAVLLYNITHQM